MSQIRSDVFISYASEDRSSAQVVADLLKSEGFIVWWDREIPIGSNWRTNIVEQLEQTKCVVVLLSQYTKNSRFVLDEADFAAEAGRLLPIQLDKTTPFGFKSIQALPGDMIADLPKALASMGILPATEGGQERLLGELVAKHRQKRNRRFFLLAGAIVPLSVVLAIAFPAAAVGIVALAGAVLLYLLVSYSS